MKKLSTFILLVLFSFFGNSQTFNFDSGIFGIGDGGIISEDLNNDGYLDIIKTGSTSGLGKSAILINDGTGNFIESRVSPFENFRYSDLTAGDVDLDGDIDFIVCGSIAVSGQTIQIETRLYLNNGLGVFTWDQTNTFTGVHFGSVELVDINNDLDLDLILTGRLNGSPYIRISEVYENDGSGNYSPANASNIEECDESYITSGDVDSDGDIDLFITGRGNSNYPLGVAILYLNDGNGVFTIDVNYNSSAYGNSELIDLNNDGFLDLIYPDYNYVEVRVLINDGIGNFTDVQSSGIPKLFLNTIVTGDYDNDGDLDVYCTGLDEVNYFGESGLYLNNGTGIFTLDLINNSLEGMRNSEALFIDVDNDNFPELFSTGFIGEINTSLLNNFHPFTQYYKNSGGILSPKNTQELTPLLHTAQLLEDFDQDNDLDIISYGYNSGSNRVAMLFINNGTGYYTEDSILPFTGLTFPAIKSFDLENDGDIDYVVCGTDLNNKPITSLVRNEGNLSFIELSTPLLNLNSASISVADINNDGFDDLCLTGVDSTSQFDVKIYTNTGSGNFIESNLNSNATSFWGIESSFADIDGDGDFDLMIQGIFNSQRENRVYVNDGNGNFTENVSTVIIGLTKGQIVFDDFDLDGDSDVLTFGTDNSNIQRSFMYLNNGSGGFSTTSSNFVDLEVYSAQLIDPDNDGDNDLIYTGVLGNTTSRTMIYQNDGSGNFTEFINDYFIDFGRADISCGDINLDGKTDVLICGDSEYGSMSHFFFNQSCQQTQSTDSVNACESFTWIDGVEYLSSNNTAQVTYPNAEGCDSIVMLDLTINTISSAPNYSGGILNANSTSALSYQWLNCLDNYSIIVGQTSATFTPNSNGEYAIITTNGNCTDTSICIIVNDLGNVVIDEDELLRISIFPNPTSVKVNIITELNIDKITIFSSVGETILNTTSKVIDLEKVAEGIYIIRVEAEGVTYNERIIKL